MSIEIIINYLNQIRNLYWISIKILTFPLINIYVEKLSNNVITIKVENVYKYIPSLYIYKSPVYNYVYMLLILKLCNFLFTFIHNLDYNKYQILFKNFNILLKKMWILWKTHWKYWYIRVKTSFLYVDNLCITFFYIFSIYI